MAICSLNKDLLRTTTCGYSLPEVKDIYLANYVEVTSAATAETSGCTEVTGITGSSGNAPRFYHIEPAKNSVTFTDELVVEDNGNKFRTHSLSFTVSGTYDKCMVGVLDALSLGRYFCVVVTADGQWLALGRIGGLEAETATLQGGGDSNGMQIVLSGNVTEPAIPLNDAAIAIVKGE